MDVEEIIKMLSEYINNLRISRITMGDPNQGNNFAWQSGNNQIIHKEEIAVVAK